MLSDEDLEAMRNEHGRIKHVVYNGVDIVLRAPKPVEIDMHALASDKGGAEKVGADKLLCQQLVVHCNGVTGAKEARLAFVELQKRFGYIHKSAKVGGALAQLTGVVEDEELKDDGSTSRPNGAPQTTMPAA